MKLSSKYDQVIALIDAANAADPVKLKINGELIPREVVYGAKHLEWVLKLEPHASELLRIAAKAQHICRWEIPRSDYPMTRPGYLKWREVLKHFHANKAGELMKEVGYEAEAITRVQSLNLKKNLKNDPECQTLEDALCLTFLELGFDDLIEKYDDEKIASIVRKTASKMSESGRAMIGTIEFSEAGQRILKQL